MKIETSELNILTPAEMHHRLIQNPKAYPIMLLHPDIPRKTLRIYKARLHVIPTKYKGRFYHGMIPNHYRKKPSHMNPKHKRSAIETMRRLNWKSNEIQTFDETIQRPDGTAIMLFSLLIPFRLRNSQKDKFLTEKINYQGTEREGIVCTYHPGVSPESLAEIDGTNTLITGIHVEENHN